MTKQQRTILAVVLGLVVVAAAVGSGILATRSTWGPEQTRQAKSPTCPSPTTPPRAVPPSETPQSREGPAAQAPMPTVPEAESKEGEVPAGAGAGAAESKKPATPKVVFMEIGAEWCGPCQSMKPIIEELKKKYKGKVGFVMIDVDRDKEAAKKYNVSAIPVQLIFKNDKQMFRHVGSISKADIEAQFKKLGVTPAS